MSEEHWTDWLFASPPGQFILGVLILVFGSRAILSEANLKEKLGGIGMVGRWIKRRKDAEAAEEADEIERLRLENQQQYAWIHQATKYLRRVELKAAQEGFELPAPRIEEYYIFYDRHYGKEDDDDDDDPE